MTRFALIIIFFMTILGCKSEPQPVAPVPSYLRVQENAVWIEGPTTIYVAISETLKPEAVRVQFQEPYYTDAYPIDIANGYTYWRLNISDTSAARSATYQRLGQWTYCCEIE